MLFWTAFYYLLNLCIITQWEVPCINIVSALKYLLKWEI